MKLLKQIAKRCIQQTSDLEKKRLGLLQTIISFAQNIDYESNKEKVHNLLDKKVYCKVIKTK